MFPLALSYDDVLLVPQYSEVASRADVDLTTQISPKLKLKLPLISTKMDNVTGTEMAIAIAKLGGMGILPRFETIESQAYKVRQVKKQNALVAAAIGIKEGYQDRAEALIKAGVDAINIDVAHGHMKKTIDVTRHIKQLYGNKVTVISGITCTQECAEDLYEAGADSLLVGVGSGSICTTRQMTGCGVPGFTSLLETSKAAKKYKKTFMPDAGIRNSGDIVKALATGASAIVAGSLFAGTDESPGKIKEIGGQKYKEYNGSASLEEKQNQVKRDPSDKSRAYTIHIEGVSAMVEYKGPLKSHVERLLAGVKSGFSYCGAKNIRELWEKAKFIQVTTHGYYESRAHSVLVQN
ncbi:hypothetical protein A2125_00715 [Candidatus Woesebacteria bacterium GWB1_43_5]|uniref:IMP dehydrogenase/GMP reductase domain-containing protein n=1 Tax=Candidatus Woesebacteria bacterium GWB1_43_5 TaxID=1802474 RepID=A0A1F7WSY8_9BACT|nr:MAG: hypothetical protein A2125_00715 [Candidatus Woesebacteria bacterium GWB1_43_5]